MDINKLLKNSKNVDEYISVTQEITHKYKNTKAHLNITTVLALKKIRSLEIEYLNKCYENGAACIIFERLLSVPPSKTWGVLGKEIVSLLQYWLEAIRKYLLDHSVHWWSFLKLILKFINEIRVKDPAMPNILVELTAECLFDIASRDKPDDYQRHEILHCLNKFCAESSREIRFALRNKFGDYFNKLAVQLGTGGFLPAQYGALEALVRWLVPRQDAARRAAAAARWLPPHRAPAAARDIFLNTTWMDFFQDARDFLNALNDGNGLVTSVVCRRLTVGNILIVSGAEKQQTWLDVNSSGNSISVLLVPRLLEAFGVRDHRACETLMIAEDNTQTAQMFSRSEEVTISVSTYRPACVQPAGIAAGGASDVSIVVSSRVDLRKLDTALRGVFGDKYHLLMDLNAELTLSPPRSRDGRRNPNSSEEDTRFSHPVEVKRKKYSGYMVATNVHRNAGGLVSPSTASTSSLAQLHDKLAALPFVIYDREPVSVCAQPQLSSVTEISEADSTFFTSHGVCYKNLKTYAEPLIKPTKKKADSDSEVLIQNSRLGRRLSPGIRDENPTSCLLVATVGSADDSVINDTIERMSKSKDSKNSSIVDLLVQEALEVKSVATKEIIIDSKNRKSQENEENSEAIENTPMQVESKDISKKATIAKKKTFTVVSKSTTDDESNTEVIYETPAFVNPRKSKLSSNKGVPNGTEPKVADKQSFDVKTVDDFFSQHFSETKAGEIILSPTLAKKINETSSETSENFDEQYLLMNEDLNANVGQFEFDDIEIIECLNDMIDKVCSDFEKCTKYFNKDNDLVRRIDNAGLVDINMSKEIHCTKASTEHTDPVSKPKRNIKLSYKVKKEKKTRTVATKRKNSTESKATKKMSTIIEQKDEEIVEDYPPKDIIQDVENVTINSPIREENESPVHNNNLETSLIKRKRKLYSPKDEKEIHNEKKGTKISETEDDDIALSEFITYNRNKTPKTTATCYKEIERERKNYIRLPRSRKSRGKVEESPSPKTLKMNAVFDKLKTTVESNEKIVLADKKTAQADMYNFTSDSDDEDFKKKKIEIQKRTSTTTVGSFESSMSTRTRRQKARSKCLEKSSNDETQKTKVVRRKKAAKKTNSKSKASVTMEPVIDMADERMREAGPEILNTSIIVEKSKEGIPSEVGLKLYEPPEMEPIADDQECTAPEKKKTNKKTKKSETLSLKKERDLRKEELKLVSDKEDDRTVSPLPGLVVESMPNREADTNESVTADMLQKFKKIYQEGPDAINESTNTQNMLLSDVERCNYSPQNVNITDEICFVDYNKGNKETKDKSQKNKKLKKNEQQLNKNKMKIKTEKTSISDKGLTREVLEISDVSNVQSEMSIATDGITAHGDLDEAPPNLEMIKNSMYPREIEDLNESMKDYFVKLNREVNESSSKERRESSKYAEDAKLNNTKRNAEGKSSNRTSPLVSVQRLSFDDISKWIPSRKSNASDSSAKSSSNKHEATEFLNVSKEYKPKFVNFDKIILDHVNSEEMQKRTSKVNKCQQFKPISVYSPRLKSPLVPITAISLEEFNNWLPMPNTPEFEEQANATVSPLQKETRQNSLKLVYNTRQKAKTVRDIKIPDVESKELNTKRPKQQVKSTNIAVKGKNKANSTENRTETDSDITSDRVTSKYNTRNTRANKSKNVIPNTTVSNSEYAAKNKNFTRSNTVISPIKSFEDFVSNTRLNDEADDAVCTKEIRDIFTKERLRSKTIDKDTTNKISDSASSKIKDAQSQDSSDRKLMGPQNSTSTHVKDIETLDSVSTNVEELFKRPMKRKSSPILCEAKKIRLDAYVDTVTIESGTSASSVNDWFKRMEPSRSRANDASLSFRDTMQNVLEKLDTTLVEINQNTSKKFVNLFVDAQSQLTSQQEQRRRAYKAVLADIVIKFADLEKRSQEMETTFKEQLKKRAFDLIREDSQQKRAMVLLLKQDVQAVIDHIDQSRADS